MATSTTPNATSTPVSSRNRAPSFVYETTAGDLIERLRSDYETWFESVRVTDTGVARRWKTEDVEMSRKFFQRAMDQAMAALASAVSNKCSLDLAQEQLVAQAATFAATLTEHTAALKRIEEQISQQILPAIAAVPANTVAPTAQPTNTQTVPTKRLSYASVVKPREKRVEATEHVVIIRPKQRGTAPATTRTALSRIADPTALGKNITRVIPSNTGQLVVGLSRPEDQTALRQTLEANAGFKANYDISVPRKRKPRIIIYGLPPTTEMNDNEMLHSLHSLNQEILQLEPDYMTFARSVSVKLHIELKPRNARESATQNIVLECPPNIARVLNSMPRVRFPWSTHRAEYHILVTRCFQCNQLGHRAKGKFPEGQPDICTKPLACSQCSEAHKYKDCPNKADANKTCCPACKAENVKAGNNKLDTKHNALSALCPTLDRYRQTEFHRTDYGC